MSYQNQDTDPKLNPPDGDESQTTTVALPQLEPPQKCPRCNSADTKFCYYNNYSLSQPRYYCKTCRRYWTRGGSLRNIPVGGRRAKRSRIATTAATTSSSPQQQQQQLSMLPSNAGFNISSTEMGPYNFPGGGFPSPFATVPPLMSLSGPPRFTPAGFSLFQGFGSLGFGRVVQGTELYQMCSSVPETSLWSGSAAAGTTNSGNTTVNVPTHSAPSAASFNPTQGSGFPGFGGP